MAVVQTRELTKQYGKFTALKSCSLQVQPGEIYGLLGPNGAGKSTLIRILMGFLRPTSGSAAITELDCYRQRKSVHRNVSYLPGEVRLFRNMRGSEVLKFFSRVRSNLDQKKAEQIAGRLKTDLSRRVAACSSGMRQKLGLSVVFAAETPLLILDEPTTHLDPTARNEVLELVREARQAGRTVLMSSHVFSEVEEVCQQVGMLRHGELVHEQAVNDIVSRHRVHAVGERERLQIPNALRDRVKDCSTREDEVLLEIPGHLDDVLPWLSQQPLQHIRIERSGLKALYEHYHLQEDA